MAYDPEIGERICADLMQGKSLQSICKEIGISAPLVCKWLADPVNEVFREQYASAREAMADTLAEEILDIADNESLPADSRRIRVDVRKWYAGKVRPKKYGDSTQIKHADADGNKLSMTELLGTLDGRTASLPSDKGKTE